MAITHVVIHVVNWCHWFQQILPLRLRRYHQPHDISAHADLVLARVEADCPVVCLAPFELSVCIAMGKASLGCKFYCLAV